MNNNLIYDVGMNNGDDTRYYLSLCYNVVAIDASPDLIKEAQMTFKKEISEGRLEILNIGIASQEGVLDFYLNKHDSVWNSFDINIGSRGGLGYEIIKVRTNSIDEIIKEKGMPYYMKIDIEGYDNLCLESMFNCLEKPEFISVELSDVGLISKLNDLGYNHFKIIDQQSFLPLEVPETKEMENFRKLINFRLSKNIFIRIIRKFFGKIIVSFYEKKFRHFFKYGHPNGSSGPFGKDLPGKWLSLQEALQVYSFYGSIHQNSKTNKGYNFWVDLHATN